MHIFLLTIWKKAILRLKMAVLPIVTGERTPILRAKTKPVSKVTKDVVTLIRDMEETTRAAKGAGLAAPQVNRSERVCIAMISKKLVPLVNPEITWRSRERETAEEGCLSLPDIWIQVPRAAEIIIQFLSAAGRQRELKLSGFDARVVQHEVDHLEGILITDHKRENIL